MESTENITAIVREIDARLVRLLALQWGEHPKEDESLEGIVTGLEADVHRIVQAVRNAEPIDPDW